MCFTIKLHKSAICFSHHSQLRLGEECKNCTRHRKVSYVFMSCRFIVENVEIASSVENVFCYKGMKRRHLFLSHLTLFRAKNSCETFLMPLRTSWPQLISVKVGTLTIGRSQIFRCSFGQLGPTATYGFIFNQLAKKQNKKPNVTTTTNYQSLIDDKIYDGQAKAQCGMSQLATQQQLHSQLIGKLPFYSLLPLSNCNWISLQCTNNIAMHQSNNGALHY